MAIVARHVEGLSLDVGRVHDFPGQVIFAGLCVRLLFGLVRNGLDRRGTVYGLGDSQATARLVSWPGYEANGAHMRLFRPVEHLAAWLGSSG